MSTTHKITQSTSDCVLRENFWTNISIQDLTHAEWEALCDGCGQCCLIKLADEEESTSNDANKVFYTNVACKLLDCTTGLCSNYKSRHSFVPDCLTLTADILHLIDWLPKTCAYRLRYENKPLPDWHPLITGMGDSTQRSGVSVSNRCISEETVDDEDLEDHIIRWVKV